ncbi:MAG: DEAD/DEAH box helicase, partial [Sciscionella sp.]
IHRIGRTGRAGKTGVAVTLVDWDDEARWKTISDALGLDKPEPVETYSTSKHLHTDLGIPEDATGRLPIGKRTRAGLSAEFEEDLGHKRKAPERRQRQRTRSSGRTGGGTSSAEPGEQPARPARHGRRRNGAAATDGPEETGSAHSEGGSEKSERPARRRRRRRGGADVSGRTSGGEGSAG